MKFSFGENWLAYSRTLDETRVRDAAASVEQLLQQRLDELSVVDVGAGSGLFSIAAARLGASRVVALDRDPLCLQAIAANASRFLGGDAGKVAILPADILNVATLPSEQFDVVYAWGSLHHTGRLWEAVENAARLCRPGGLVALAIYNRTAFTQGWLRLKQLYNVSPAPIRFLLAAALTAPRVAVRILRRKSPFKLERGMSVWYDSIDWLGGLPYEAASPAAVLERMRHLGFEATRSSLTERHGCNEFVFRHVRGRPLRT